jgi:RND family efflux transporter MFP subunit
MQKKDQPRTSLGETKKRLLPFITGLVILGLLIVFTGCNRGSGPPGQRGRTREEVPVPVIVEEVRLRDLEEFINITGKLEGITDITMISETSGRVLSLSKSLGDWINEGEKIGELDNEIIRIRLEQAKAALASAQAALETAEMNYRTGSKLYRDGSVSQAEYQQALFAWQGAVAQRDGASANLESAQKAYENSLLLAPVSGNISSLPLKVGETIFPNTPIAGIVNHRELLLKGGISENHILGVKKGQPVTLTYRGKEYPARVKGIGVKPLPNSATYPVEIILANGDGELLPGMVVNASIQINVYSDLIYTDSGNIRTSFDDHFVYTVDENMEAVRKNITKGKTVNEFTIITSGLETGDLVVVEGIDTLQEGMKVNVRN